jgi:hypothetical protein
MRKAFTRHGLGMPPRNPKAVRQRAIAAASAGTSQSATYLADPHRVLEAGDTALVVAARAINVTRRGDDSSWR